MVENAAPEAGAGQTAAGPETPATAAAPAESAGQAGTAGESTGQAAQADPGAVEEFYDSKKVPKHLDEDYRNMQAAFTKKMQALSAVRQKAEFADKFQQNPLDVVQRVAEQYGMRLTPAQAAAVANTQGQAEEWQPQKWDDVIARTKKETTDAILQQLRPIFQEVQAMKQSTIERQLSEIDPTWQQYEEAMVEKLKKHPTLATDPAELYRLSVPQEVIESRATQKALQRFEQKGKAATASTGSTTSKKQSGQVREASSFEEAVAIAKEQLAEMGIAPPK